MRCLVGTFYVAMSWRSLLTSLARDAQGPHAAMPGTTGHAGVARPGGHVDKAGHGPRMSGAGPHWPGIHAATTCSNPLDSRLSK